MIPESPLNQMLDAARHGQWKVVDKLIQAGTPVNEWHPDTQTPIIAMLAENLLAANEDPKARVHAYFRVNGLIERGGSIFWALYGAAFGGNRDLMEELLKDLTRYDTKGVALFDGNYPHEEGLNWAVMGAARSNNHTLMTDLRKRGASVDWAVRGAALGRQRDLVMELLDQGANWGGAMECAGQSGDGALVAELFTRWHSIDLSYTSILGAARGGHSELVKSLLAKNYTADRVRAALRGAASGGHRLLVTELLEKVPEEFRSENRRLHCGAGAFEGGHVALMEIYFGQPEAYGFGLKFALSAEQFELVNQRLTPEHTQQLYRAAIDLGYFHTEARREAFLAKIRDPEMRKALVRHEIRFDRVSVVLLPSLQRANAPIKKYGLSYSAALVWYQHKEVLPILLSSAGSLVALPGDLKQRIARYYVGVHVLNQADAHGLYTATNAAYSGVKERCQAAAVATTQLAEEYAKRGKAHRFWLDGVCQKSTYSAKGHKKAMALRSAASMEEQIDALCMQRHSFITPKSFLPKSMREMMEKFPEFRNVLALRYWLSNCAEYMSTRFDRNQQFLGSRLKVFLPFLKNLSSECTDVRFLASILNKTTSNSDGFSTIESILSWQPYWKDLLALFPGLEEALVEVMNEDPVSRLA